MNKRCVSLTALAATLIVSATAAKADLKISDQPTRNVACTSGVCSAQGKKAVLNVMDLTNLLSVGNVTVQAGAEAKDIDVDADVSWTSSARLTLDATQAITFKRKLFVNGSGSLTMMTDAQTPGGDINYVGGAVRFANIVHSELIINGNGYFLYDSVKSFARNFKHFDGTGYYYALAKNVRSGKRYSTPPININFNGTFDGLGNTISGLNVASNNGSSGFFNEINKLGIVRDLNLKDVNISDGGFTGALAGSNLGTVINCSSSGQVGAEGMVGGLVGGNSGLILNSHSSAIVASTGDGTIIGGLVGASGYPEQGAYGKIISSFATGSLIGADHDKIGGLLGSNEGGEILDSYATGSVDGDDNSEAGGLIGENSTAFGPPIVSQSYATGHVFGGQGTMLGGLIGDDLAETGTANTYWDLDTTGINNPSQGAGNVANDTGITGLTTEQFLAALPANFDKKVWKQKASLNGGYPYLVDNPPLK